nr:ring finger protein 5 [Hymenolepis microstoma]
MDGAGNPSSSSSSQPDSTTTHRGTARNEDGNPREDEAGPSTTSPADQPQAPSSSTSGNFECNICLEQATDAVVSRCGHLFCWPCLHQWMEVKKALAVCPVCKAAISRDSVIPLYGRGADHKQDPRNKVPPRPQGVRTEPERQREFPFSPFNIFGGNTDVGGGGGGGGSGVQVSFGFAPFPFGLFATSFNLGGGGGNGAATTNPGGQNNNQAEVEVLSKFFLALAIFFIVWLLITQMVRVKYRYIISIVSVGSSSSGTGTSQGVQNRAAFPGYSISLSSSMSTNSNSNSENVLYRAIRQSVQAAHGSFGVGRMMTRFKIIYWNPVSGLLIIRVLRGLTTDQMTSALSLITSVPDGSVERPAVIDVIHRSGTVRCCQRFIADYYKTQLSGCISGVKETAIARAVARGLLESKPPTLATDS